MFGSSEPLPVAECVAQSIGREGYWLFVARDGGALAGYCALHGAPFLLIGGDEGYITELFIAGEGRSKGVGNALLERAVETATAAGFRARRTARRRRRRSARPTARRRFPDCRPG